jgi:hypothetical protein
LLQSERFRRDVLSPAVVAQLGEEGLRGVMERWSNGDGKS